MKSSYSWHIRIVHTIVGNTHTRDEFTDDISQLIKGMETAISLFGYSLISFNSKENLYCNNSGDTIKIIKTKIED